jgi:hypothetical protein
MTSAELYQVIGNIIYSFSRIDFLISNIGVNFQLSDSYENFYARRNFDEKIKDLKKKSSESILDTKLKSDFDGCLTELDEFRLIRNNIIHRILLQNIERSSEFIIHNFSKTKDGIRWYIAEYTSAELQEINSSLIGLHNKIASLYRLTKHNS